MNIFFTSDLHFFHSNVIKYSNRPFVDVAEMNATLIKNWNSVVKSEDKVYLLGDVSFSNPTNTKLVLDQLNGSICLVAGNHDSYKTLSKMNRFEWIRDYYELKIENPEAHRGCDKFILFHFPIEFWNNKHHGIFHLHGHSHGSIPKNYNLRRIDMGVDCWNYFPVSYEQLKEEMKKYSFPTYDHHQNEI